MQIIENQARSMWLASAMLFVAPQTVDAAVVAKRSIVAKPESEQSTFTTAVDTALARWSFNGVVLVHQRHGPAILRPFGIANNETQQHSTARTLYQTGSFSKWIASVIILRLVDQGKLSLNMPISTYLPDYRADTGSIITLHTLLSHTSGVPNEMAAALSKDEVAASYADISVEQAVKRYASGDLIFEPGSKFDYSHSNWLLVEAIIERVGGKTYRQIVRDMLTVPLHLDESGIMPSDFMTIKNAADGYSTLLPQPKLAPRKLSVPFPAIAASFGGYYASAPDMVRVLDAVYDTDFLSKSSRESLWRVNVPGQNYAYGGRVFQIDLGDKKHKVARNNNANGAYKTYDLRVDDGTTILLLNNTRMDQQQLNDMGDALLTAAYPNRPL